MCKSHLFDFGRQTFRCHKNMFWSQTRSCPSPSLLERHLLRWCLWQRLSEVGPECHHTSRRTMWKNVNEILILKLLSIYSHVDIFSCSMLIRLSSLPLFDRSQRTPYVAIESRDTDWTHIVTCESLTVAGVHGTLKRNKRRRRKFSNLILVELSTSTLFHPSCHPMNYYYYSVTHTWERRCVLPRLSKFGHSLSPKKKRIPVDRPQYLDLFPVAVRLSAK